MRVLIVGAKGQLGRDLVKVFEKDHELRAVDIDEIDITDPEAVQRVGQEFRPEWVINAAAYTAVELAEENEAAAFQVNEAAARHVAAMAASHNAPVVYYSTDYVFGQGQTTPFQPDDTIAPIGVYGRSKEAGERATRDAQPNHYILRTAWLYGPGGNNFVEKILQLAQSRPELKVVEDEIGSPTHTLDLAQATLALTHTNAPGTYHVVNRGQCSRYEFACEIIRLAGLTTTIHPCPSTEFPTTAERPLYSVLNVDKFEQATQHTLPQWQDALATYMQRR